MNILVTGASGLIGLALSRALVARGYSVRAVVRGAGAPSEDSPGLHRVAVEDIAGEIDRRALLEGIDVVVHLAAIAHRAAADAYEIRRVNVEGTARLADAASGSVRRFVFLSSVKVHGEDSGDGAYTETDPTLPEDAYGRSKLEAEHVLADLAARSGMEIVFVRPPLVYGPGVKANFLRLLRWIDSGLPLPFAGVSNRRSLVYLGNLVDAVARCVEHPRALGPFLVSDEEVVSTPELVSRAARALERPARLVRVPLGVLRLTGALTGRGEELRRLTGNLVIDTSKARRVLDWRPPHSLEEGLAQTARWFRSVRLSANEGTR
jgi:nucleoside-diphosphate-sugar epimerase